jgi:hypothetical protein
MRVGDSEEEIYIAKMSYSSQAKALFNVFIAGKYYHRAFDYALIRLIYLPLTTQKRQPYHLTRLFLIESSRLSSAQRKYISDWFEQF